MSITYRFRRDEGYGRVSGTDLHIDSENALALFCGRMGGGWQCELKAEDAISATYMITPPSQFDPDRAAATLSELCGQFALVCSAVSPEI